MDYTYSKTVTIETYDDLREWRNSVAKLLENNDVQYIEVTVYEVKKDVVTFCSRIKICVSKFYYYSNVTLLRSIYELGVNVINNGCEIGLTTEYATNN